MKKTFLLMAVALSATAIAQELPQLDNMKPSNASIAGNPDLPKNNLGSGNVTNLGQPVIGKNIFQVPQYLPYYPTAAVIYPRVVNVTCVEGQECGYNWSPELGRAEYLYIQKTVVAAPKAPEPVIVEKIVPGPERIILKEVPPKKKRE